MAESVPYLKRTTTTAAPAATKPDTETTLFQTCRKEFADGKVTVERFGLDHPKLVHRNVAEEQIGVRVVFKGRDQRAKQDVNYGVAGMVPVSASSEVIQQLIGRLKRDRINAEKALQPDVAV